MIITPSQFDGLYGRYSAEVGRVRRSGFQRYRKRLLERDKANRLLDTGIAWLADCKFPASELKPGKRGYEALKDALRKRGEEEFGVPIWVFAILLKVLASVLIDWWLLHGEARGA